MPPYWITATLLVSGPGLKIISPGVPLVAPVMSLPRQAAPDWPVYCIAYPAASVVSQMAAPSELAKILGGHEGGRADAIRRDEEHTTQALGFELRRRLGQRRRTAVIEGQQRGAPRADLGEVR